jgi:hypothetical protein
MKSGQCPKCKNQTVYKSASGIGYGKRGSFYAFTSALNMPTPVEDYVCTTCGYFESYITDRGKLDEVGQKWEQVS